MEAPKLTWTGGGLVRLDAGTYQWIAVSGFEVAGESDDRRLLAALLGHPRYDDALAGGDVPTGAGLHGPYRIEAINPDDFVPIAADAAIRRLRDWAGTDGTPSAQTERALDSRVFGVLGDAGIVYALRPLPAEVRHEWGFVVGRTGFHEFVAISPRRDRLTLLVGSDD